MPAAVHSTPVGSMRGCPGSCCHALASGNLACIAGGFTAIPLGTEMQAMATIYLYICMQKKQGRVLEILGLQSSNWPS